MSGYLAEPNYNNRFLSFLSLIIGLFLVSASQFPGWLALWFPGSVLILPIIGGVLLASSLFHLLINKIDYPSTLSYYLFLMALGVLTTSTVALLSVFGPFGLAGFFPLLGPIISYPIDDEENATSKILVTLTVTFFMLIPAILVPAIDVYTLSLAAPTSELLYVLSTIAFSMSSFACYVFWHSTSYKEFYIPFNPGSPMKKTLGVTFMGAIGFTMLIFWQAPKLKALLSLASWPVPVFSNLLFPLLAGTLFFGAFFQFLGRNQLLVNGIENLPSPLKTAFYSSSFTYGMIVTSLLLLIQTLGPIGPWGLIIFAPPLITITLGEYLGSNINGSPTFAGKEVFHQLCILISVFLLSSALVCLIHPALLFTPQPYLLGALGLSGISTRCLSEYAFKNLLQQAKELPGAPRITVESMRVDSGSTLGALAVAARPHPSSGAAIAERPIPEETVNTFAHM